MNPYQIASEIFSEPVEGETVEDCKRSLELAEQRVAEMRRMYWRSGELAALGALRGVQERMRRLAA